MAKKNSKTKGKKAKTSTKKSAPKKAKPRFNKKALLAYAELHEIKIPKKLTKKDELLKFILKKIDADADIECDECGTPCCADDTFCLYCGGDVTADDTGGFDAYLASLEEEDEEDEVEIDDTEEDEDSEEEDDEEEDDEEEDDEEDEEEDEDTEEDSEEDEEVEDDEEDEDSEEDERSYEERLDAIRKLDRSSGENAHELGHELYEMMESKSYQDGGHETFKDFCENEIGYTQQAARGFIRIYENFEQDQAGRLGVAKCLAIANAPDKLRRKLLKEGKKGLKAESMSSREVAEAVKEARKADAEANGEKPNASGPRKTKLGALLELKAKTKKPPKGFLKGGESMTFDLDGFLGLELSMTKKGSIKIQFVQWESEADGE